MAVRTFAMFAVLASVALINACSSRDDAQERREADAAVAAQVPGGPATLPVQDASNLATQPDVDAAGAATTGGVATMPTAGTSFDPASVPVSSAALPPFPFFKDPEGLENELKGSDAMRPFDRHGFIAGGSFVTQEGRIALFQYNLDNPPSGRRYSQLEFLRNYENAIGALGGRRISTAQFTPEFVTASGGREQIEKYWAAASPPVIEAEHATYLVRTADKEYWIHVSAGGIIPLMGFVTVLEKQAMQSSLGFLDAAAMKKELDAKGRVALYINFDTDKATLRPDAQPIIDEINKLLGADASLKLSIEGHTDGTGGADHNRQLSTARARAVFGALVGLGVDPARLASKGFGPDKPIADNATDDGRAKNRRVELVKTN
jgi:OOP family OmpA-OmpF porin